MIRTLFAALLIIVAGNVAAADEPQDNAKLVRLFGEDQADRAPGKPIDWTVVSERDEAREMRVKQMIEQGVLVTGADHYHAAMILQHAPTPEDYLLAHDLCVVAIGKGHEHAKWLAAASLDRFLINIGRPQRFGTQFQSRRPNRPPRLVAVDQNVPDSLRRALNVPTLEEAKRNEAQMVKQFEEMHGKPE